MKSLVEWCGRTFPAVAVFAALLIVPAHADAPGESDVISVALDQATIVRLPPRVATLVIGNPLIADVSLQPGGMIVITGKGYGLTNLIALDRGGAVLTEKAIEVNGPLGHVVMYKGAERESYSCTPRCSRRNTLGDSQPYFDSTLAQIVTRSDQALGLGQGAK